MTYTKAWWIVSHQASVGSRHYFPECIGAHKMPVLFTGCHDVAMNLVVFVNFVTFVLPEERQWTVRFQILSIRLVPRPFIHVLGFTYWQRRFTGGSIVGVRAVWGPFNFSLCWCAFRRGRWIDLRVARDGTSVWQRVRVRQLGRLQSGVGRVMGCVISGVV